LFLHNILFNFIQKSNKIIALLYVKLNNMPNDPALL
jgi:hypothetical protein